MTTKEFALRFSSEEWTRLCSATEFISALEAEDFTLAETIASQLLTRTSSPDADHRHDAGKLENLVTLHIPAAAKNLEQKKKITNAAKAVRRAETVLQKLQNEAASLRERIRRN